MKKAHLAAASAGLSDQNEADKDVDDPMATQIACSWTLKRSCVIYKGLQTAIFDQVIC